MKSWKTTMAGALLLLAGVVGMSLGYIKPEAGAPLIVMGLGLIAARDNDVTSEQAGAK